MKKKLTFLGIETSCDETAAAVVQQEQMVRLRFYQVKYLVNQKFTKNLEVLCLK